MYLLVCLDVVGRRMERNLGWRRTILNGSSQVTVNLGFRFRLRQECTSLTIIRDAIQPHTHIWKLILWLLRLYRTLEENFQASLLKEDFVLPRLGISFLQAAYEANRKKTNTLQTVFSTWEKQYYTTQLKFMAMSANRNTRARYSIIAILLATCIFCQCSTGPRDRHDCSKGRIQKDPPMPRFTKGNIVEITYPNLVPVFSATAVGMTVPTFVYV